MSNSIGEAMATFGFVMLFGGGLVIVMETIEGHERQLNVFLESVIPNLGVSGWAGVMVVCGFWLFLAGLLIDTYGEEFGGDD